MRDIYYVRDTCELTCAACAFDALAAAVDDEHRHTDPDDNRGPRRLAAAIRLARLDTKHRRPTVYDVERVLPRYVETWQHGDPDRPALELLWDICHDVTDDEHSADGEYCGGCHAELVPAWVRCLNCGHDGSADRFPYLAGYDTESDGDGRGPYVEYCACCEHEAGLAGAVVLLADDGRGYVLRTYDRDGETIYAAGCRRFTLEQALEHWDPAYHPSPGPARRLADACREHAGLLV